MSALSIFTFFHRRHRAIWQELFNLREQNTLLRKDIVELRKQIVLSRVENAKRLPPLMPSQYGEDVLLWKFFQEKREGFYIDVGAYNGIALSNTYFFEALGWGGVLIEAVPEFFKACVVSRPHSRVVNAVVSNGVKAEALFSIAEGNNGLETLSFAGNNPTQLERIKREGGTVRTTAIPSYSLNEILNDHDGPIDFVSIDVEGGEMEVLYGFDIRKFSPRVVVIEDNSNGVDTRACEWFRAHDYEERFRCEHNVFYTHKDEEQGFCW